jgi:methionyl-tRNA formyltransferase
MAALRTVFMGTAELSCRSLQVLAQVPEVKLVAVVSQPDRPKGRDLRLQPSPVKELANRLGLTVLQPERAREKAFLEALQELKPDLVTVAAYGQILPKTILDLPRFGCLNVHTSLLPKYRGAAPIQWAILNGESETGVTIMKMDPGLDTGGIIAQERTAIRPEDNAETLHDRLAELGASLLVRTIPPFVAGTIQPRPQPAEGVSYAPRIKKEDGLIDWSLGAAVIRNRIRGLAPWPGAFTFLLGSPKPHLLKLWEAEVVDRNGAPGEIVQADKTGIVVACGQKAVRVLRLQREGGRKLSAQEFLAGHRLKPGEELGTSIEIT